MLGGRDIDFLGPIPSGAKTFQELNTGCEVMLMKAIVDRTFERRRHRNSSCVVCHHFSQASGRQIVRRESAEYVSGGKDGNFWNGYLRSA